VLDRTMNNEPHPVPPKNRCTRHDLKAMTEQIVLNRKTYDRKTYVTRPLAPYHSIGCLAVTSLRYSEAFLLSMRGVVRWLVLKFSMDIQSRLIREEQLKDQGLHRLGKALLAGGYNVKPSQSNQ
jgi:hypothetical protein